MPLSSAPTRLFELAEVIPVPATSSAPLESVFRATIVLYKVAVPAPVTSSPPPEPAPRLLFWSAMVVLTAVSVPSSLIPPPEAPELPAIVVFVSDALERYSSEAQTSESAAHTGIIGFMARSRWFWLPPLYALALIFLLIVTLTRGASTAQFMYNKF